jgi:hypothetical protein
MSCTLCISFILQSLKIKTNHQCLNKDEDRMTHQGGNECAMEEHFASLATWMYNYCLFVNQSTAVSCKIEKPARCTDKGSRGCLQDRICHGPVAAAANLQAEQRVTDLTAAIETKSLRSFEGQYALRIS